MEKATLQRGFQYFRVADHSKSAPGGDRLNKRFGKYFRILKGIDSDILADGTRCFDFVVASIQAASSWTRRRRPTACFGPFRTAHNDHPPHDWPSTAAAAGYDITAARLRRVWRGRRDQRPSVAARSGLAMAPGGARLRLHDEHQSGRALDCRTGSHALGASRWRARAACRRTAS